MAHTAGSATECGPLGLFSLFSAPQIFEDTNQDGYPDRLGLVIEVDPRLDDALIWAQVLNLAARLAIEVTALDLPLVRPLRSKPGNEPALVVRCPDPNLAGAAEIKHQKPARVAIGGRCPLSIARVIAGLALSPSSGGLLSQNWRTIRLAEPEARAMEIFYDRHSAVERIPLPPFPIPGKSCGRFASPIKLDLLNPFGCAYDVPPDEPRGQYLNLKLVIDPLRLSPQLGMVLSDLVAAAVLEATDMTLPLVVTGSMPQTGLVLKVCEQKPKRPGITHQIRLFTRRSKRHRVILAEGQTKPLTEALREWTQLALYRHGSGCEPVDAFHTKVEGVQDLVAGCGRWGRWAHLLMRAAAGGTVLPPASGPERTKVLRACRALCLAPPTKASSSTLYRHSSWRSENQQILDLARQIRPGTGTLEGLVFVSKPRYTRLELKKQLTSILSQKGYRVHLAVLNAYKPGLSWLIEVVAKMLQGVEKPADIELAYRPFKVDGGSLELPGRWLQEIFPGPDLLAGALGWKPDRIRLIRRGNLSDAYRIRVWNAQGRLVLTRGFTPRISRLPYLAGRPQAGTIYPTCGGIRLRRGQSTILDRAVMTDRERFWRTFQTRWLPALEARMLKYLAALNGDMIPAFWEEIRLEVALEETDVRLNLGAERICPMEALHEDLYFGLLNFFQIFVREHNLAPAIQFGRILPLVSSRLKGARPSAHMIARPFQQPASKGAGRSRPQVTALSFEGGQWHLEFSGGIKGLTPANVRHLCAVAHAWGISLEPSPMQGRLQVKIKTPRPVPRAAYRSGRKSPPPEDRLLSAQEVSGWIQHFGRMPHLQAWQAGRSWQGRPIWVIEAGLLGGGKLASVAKARVLKPTLLINARHHANEISSTNAVLHLAWQLSTTRQGRKILQQTNIVIIPLENADGVAALEALLPEAPDHKLHAARYNALGVEWYSDYFADPPRFAEARVKPRLWRRWLPQIVLDAHGVPSHEWDQPFAGYVPVKPFQEFWLPKTFVYAIVPFINRPGHPGHAMAGRLVHRMRQALTNDREIIDLNRALNDRYRRYARSAEPGIFPACSEDALVALPPQKRVAKTNFAERCWPLTQSEIITEVTDEVASGRLLALCARAHRRIAGALIEFMRPEKPGAITRTQLPDGGVMLKWRR
jgi:Zinc carboxypeptidase